MSCSDNDKINRIIKWLKTNEEWVKNLNDIQKALNKFYEKKCPNGLTPCEFDGILPECLWSDCPPPLPPNIDIAMASGIVDGVYANISGLDETAQCIEKILQLPGKYLNELIWCKVEMLTSSEYIELCHRMATMTIIDWEDANITESIAKYKSDGFWNTVKESGMQLVHPAAEEICDEHKGTVEQVDAFLYTLTEKETWLNAYKAIGDALSGMWSRTQDMDCHSRFYIGYWGAKLIFDPAVLLGKVTKGVKVIRNLKAADIPPNFDDIPALNEKFVRKAVDDIYARRFTGKEELRKKFYGDFNGDSKLATRILDDENLFKAWKGLLNTGLRTDIPWLTRASKWLGEGAEFAADGSGKLSKNGKQILEVKNNKILPDKYDFDPSTGKPKTGGTAVGEPANGYQVYKHGDDISVRRVPETSGYSQSEIDFLTNSPDGHALQRHGHDVTDEALIKRSTEGITPDGELNNFPAGGVSSKFSNEQAVKDAINNVKPGTPAYDAGELVVDQATGEVRRIVEAPGNYGYGFKANGKGGPQQMQKVTAVYKQTSDGSFKLETMYPNKEIF